MSVTIAQAIAQIGVGYRAPSVATLGMQNPFGKQDGRSGYWRLFYIQLQEQALKEGKTEKAEKPFKEPFKVIETTDGGAKVVYPAKRPRAEPIEDNSDIREAAPIVFTASPPVKREAELPPVVNLWQLTTWRRSLVLQYNNNALQYELQKASSDEEEAVEILLLAA